MSAPTFVAKYFLKSGQKKYTNLAQKEETMYITMPQLFIEYSYLFIKLVSENLSLEKISLACSRV